MLLNGLFELSTLYNVQPDHINVAVLFWHSKKSGVSYVRYCKCTRIHGPSHFLQSTRNTRPCITGHPVDRAAGLHGQLYLRF